VSFSLCISLIFSSSQPLGDWLIVDRAPLTKRLCDDRSAITVVRGFSRVGKTFLVRKALPSALYIDCKNLFADPEVDPEAILLADQFQDVGIDGLVVSQGAGGKQGGSRGGNGGAGGAQGGGQGRQGAGGSRGDRKKGRK
jgi:uncharacterized membrane protein YgcG